jgi:predicted transcriptional regulator
MPDSDDGDRGVVASTLNPLAPLEFAVMKGLWTMRAATAVELTAILNRERHDPLSAKTTLTCLTRLEAKGLVSHSKAERAFLFSPTKTEVELSTWFIGERFRPIIDHYGNVAVAVFVSLIGENPVRFQHLRDLVEALDEGGSS